MKTKNKSICIKRPKKAQLDDAIGKIVELILVDGDQLIGELHKSGEKRFKNDSELYLRKGWYVLLGTDLIFRSSHVKQMEILDLLAIQKFVEGLDEECCCVCQFKDDCHGFTVNGTGIPCFPPCSDGFSEKWVNLSLALKEMKDRSDAI